MNAQDKILRELSNLETPAAIIDGWRMSSNIKLMQDRMDNLGVAFRPHVKTAKSLNITEIQLAAGAQGITVSTLKEAEQFFGDKISDIIYAVGISASKLPHVLRLMNQGCDLKIITDNVETARAITAFGKANKAVFKVLIEIDTDGHRSGIPPEGSELLAVAEALAGTEYGAELYGVLTHAGESYGLSDPVSLERMAEQERAGCVRAAERLREAGHACPVVSVGSTPTALSAGNLAGVTEVRAGVYVFFDLVMHNIGVCTLEDIALSVLTTVIGHQKEKGLAIVDAGWMSMSRDRGTARQKTDFGYGQVCDLNGTPLPGYIVSGANQEHGIISLANGRDENIVANFPVGTLLRILPNHACATAAQFPEYHIITIQNKVETWPRFYGW